MLVAAAGISLAGCASDNRIATVKDGASKIFSPPPHVIKGATRVDQSWIDETIESGISGLGWKRPGPRPPGLDAVKPVAVPAPVKKKRPFWRVFGA